MSLFDFLFSKTKSPAGEKHKTIQEDLQFHSWNVRIIRRSKRKSLTIEVRKGSPLIVRASLSIPKKKILHFLELKKDWIEKHYQAMSELPSQNFFEPNEKGEILVLGGYYQLKPNELSTFNSKKFYTAKAKKYIPTKVHEIAKNMELFPSEISIRYMRSRWGSCTAKGKVTLNSKILAAPEWIIESVIVHELAHLKHMNHSAAFWTLVNQYSPEHKQADKWLKKFL